MRAKPSDHPLIRRRKRLGDRARLGLVLVIGFVLLLAMAYLVNRGYRYPAKRTDWRSEVPR